MFMYVKLILIYNSCIKKIKCYIPYNIIYRVISMHFFYSLHAVDIRIVIGVATSSALIIGILIIVIIVLSRIVDFQRKEVSPPTHL